MYLTGADVGPDADDAHAAQGQHGDDHIIVAGEEDEFVIRQPRHLRRIGDVAAGFLDAAHVGQLRERFHALHRERTARAARHVVKEDGQIDRLGHGGKVAVHALLVGLVVVRRDEQKAVRAQIAELAALRKRRFRAVGAAAGDDRDAAADGVHAAADDGRVLGGVRGAGFARGAEDDKTVRAVFHVPLAKLLQALEVDASIRVKGGHQRHITAFKHGRTSAFSVLNIIAESVAFCKFWLRVAHFVRASNTCVPVARTVPLPKIASFTTVDKQI